MDSNRCFARSRLVLGLPVLLFLSGCASTIGNRIDDSITHAQAVHEHCAEIEQSMGDPAGKISLESILARLRLRLAPICDTNGDLKTSLADGIKDCVFDLSGANLPALANSAIAAKLKTKVDAIKVDEGNIKAALIRLDTSQKIPDFCKMNRNTCAKTLFTFLLTEKATLNSLKLNLKKLDDDATALNGSISEAEGSLASDANSADQSVVNTRSQLEEMSKEIAGSIGQAQKTISALDFQDIDQTVKLIFTNEAYSDAAESTLRVIQKGLIPVDRLIDKVDDETYLISAFAMTWYQPKLQDALNKLYVQDIRNKLPLEMQGAFAVAACKKLEADENSASTSPSVTMSFFLEMFTNVDAQATEIAKCTKQFGTSENTATCVQNSPAKANSPEALSAAKSRIDTSGTTPKLISMVGDQSGDAAAGEEGTAVSPAAIAQSIEQMPLSEKVAQASSFAQSQGFDMPDNKKFETFVLAEIATRKQLANAGLPIDEEKVHSIAIRAAGNAIEDYQQQCAAGACGVDPVRKRMALAMPSISVAKFVNVAVSQLQFQSVRVNVSPPAPAAPPAPETGPSTTLCANLNTTRILTRCISLRNGAARVELLQSFALDASSSPQIEETLKVLGEVLRLGVQRYDIVAYGTASSSVAACDRKRDRAIPYRLKNGNSVNIECNATEGDGPIPDTDVGGERVERNGNFILSLRRADWASQRLKAYSGMALNNITLLPLSSKEALKSETAEDRGVYFDLLPYPTAH